MTSTSPDAKPIPSTVSPPTVDSPPSPPTRTSTTASSDLHEATAAKLRRPSVDTSTRAINAGAPLELDSTPVSPQVAVAHRQGSWPSGRGGVAKDSISPDVDEVAYESVGGPKGENAELREKRAALLSQRSKDPAVLVDIPQTPGPNDYEVADKVVNGETADVNRPSSDKGVVGSGSGISSNKAGGAAGSTAAATAATME